MCKNNDYKEVCSVSQLADRLGISRTRFYQLLEAGIFPPPFYCSCMKKRPFYTYELQQKCIAIRRTGIGYNGRVVLFYTKRKSRTTGSSITPQNTPSEIYQRLTKIMKQTGINVTINDVKEAVKIIYPEGLTTNEANEKVITTLYGYFRSEGQDGM